MKILSGGQKISNYVSILAHWDQVIFKETKSSMYALNYRTNASVFFKWLDLDLSEHFNLIKSVNE